MPKSEIKSEIQGKNWDKRQTLLRLYHEHPHASLRVGTLTANVRGVCSDLTREVTTSIREAIGILADVKRQGQELIGMFIQHVVVKALESDNSVSTTDQELLDAICPRLAKPGTEDDEDVSDDAQVDEDDKSLHYQFLFRLLAHLFSGNVRNDNPVGRLVQKFINRASELKLCDPFSITPTRNQLPLPCKVLWSVARELAREIKMHYGGGCEKIQKQVGAGTGKLAKIWLQNKRARF